jgi:hypothetical protein
VGYHTLTVELIAKTLEHHHGRLTVGRLVEELKKFRLDRAELQRSITLDHAAGPTQLYGHLIKTFHLAGLGDYEKHLLMHLALMPAEPLAHELLVDLIGVPEREGRKLMKPSPGS